MPGVVRNTKTREEMKAALPGGETIREEIASGLYIETAILADGSIWQFDKRFEHWACVRVGGLR